MGMILRRHKRPAEALPVVNGKPIRKEPKNRSLTDNKSQATKPNNQQI
jgi:hypothetical protein